MSRSNPVEKARHVCDRWYEWKGGDGHFRYYDKEAKENVDVKLPFQFILLDRTVTVRGYNKKKKSGLFSNEIRDVMTEPLVVKFFNDTAHPVAVGTWSEIKDKVTVNGGKYALNCYIAYKDGKDLKLGALQLTGCALGPWFDFEKEHGKKVQSPFDKKLQIAEIYAGGIQVKKTEKGETGDVEFLSPVFELAKTTKESNDNAIALDKELQEYFKTYFSRPRSEQAASSHPAERPQADAPDDAPQDDVPTEGDDVPF